MSDELDDKPVRWLGTPEGLAQLREVDVVFAVDRATGKEMLVFGRSLLQLIRNGYEGPSGLAYRVLLEYRTGHGNRWFNFPIHPQSESSGTLVRLARSTRRPLVPTRVEIGA